MATRGRKPGPSGPKSVTTGIRFDPGLKEKLDAARFRSGRSFAAEVSARLDASFDALEFSDPDTKALCALIALALADVQQDAGNAWPDNPWTFCHARDAALQVMSFWEPNGEIAVPENAPAIRALRAQKMDDLADKAKAQMAVWRLGHHVGTGTVAMVEAIGNGSPSPDRAYLLPIALVLKSRLAATGRTGEAHAELNAEVGEPGSGVTL